MTSPTRSWVVVVPVKNLESAKTRMAHPSRPELALAMALDTIQAAVRTPSVREVLVVTGDPVVARAVPRTGVRVVRDDGAGDLNRCLVAAVEDLPSGQPVVVMVADLPSARPDELALLLDSAPEHGAAVVGDREGHGTTLLLATEPSRLHPRFGVGSLARHLAGGALDLSASAGPGLRLDVDVIDDLDAAAATVGTATSAVIIGPSSLRRVTGSVVQATVRSFDPSNRSGTVLRDDGLELAFDAGAFDAGGALKLRLGQRVRLDYDDDGVLTSVGIATFPRPG